MALPTRIEATNIAVDHEWAQSYTLSYLSDLQTELAAQANILNLSMNAFNKFLELPETDNRAGAVWDLAFTLLSTAVPALGLVKFVDKMHKASSVAVQIATSAGLKSGVADVVRLATKTLQEGAKLANRLNDYKEAAGDVSEAREKLKEPDDQFAGLDPARKVVYELIDASRKATAAFKGAAAAETLEYTMRIYGITKPAGSLQDYIQNLLPPVPILTRAELQEIEKLYLWLMIGHHCREHVKMYRTTETFHRHTPRSARETARGKTSISAEGLKKSQEDMILKEFGPTSKRGKWFTGPHLHPARPWDIYLFLAWHQVPVLPRTYAVATFSPSSKL
jgi:hypothetical protein